jgi:hypothetical protein
VQPLVTYRSPVVIMDGVVLDGEGDVVVVVVVQWSAEFLSRESFPDALLEKFWKFEDRLLT